ncbi:MAG: hypothetical protein ACFE9S_02760 [Candidatus Hermodarchaeota archaeon]
MAYTTCTFWIKFFAFWFVLSGVGSLMTVLICPTGFLGTGCAFVSFFIAGVICSPILFANQIYFAITKKQKSSKYASHEMNKTWLNQNYDYIENQYVNHFVAIHDLQIIDSDKDLNILKERIKHKQLNPNKVYIQFIKSKEEKESYDKIGRKI